MKRERDCELVRQTSVNDSPTDLKDAEVPAVIAINQASLSPFDGDRTNRYQPNIEKCHRQRQTGQTQEMSEMSAFQVEPMAFHITEHLFNGIITNDKFCMSRSVRLKLTWWRRPLHSRTAKAGEIVYPSGETSRRGGIHEPSVEGPPAVD